MGIWRHASDSELDPDLIRDGMQLEDCPFCGLQLEVIDELFGESQHGAYLLTTVFQLCHCCGWWNGVLIGEPSVGEDLVRGGVGALAILDLSDLTAPITEVRRYLSAKYDVRFEVHPRKFEEVVGSVFSDLGYDVLVTGYSGDDGIDAILTKGAERVGVQVKRYRAAIEVEQIRSFAGALILNGVHSGIFVTTSRFQAGAKTTTKRYVQRGYKIELWDGKRFFDALRAAQLTRPIDVQELIVELHEAKYRLPWIMKEGIDICPAVYPLSWAARRAAEQEHEIEHGIRRFAEHRIRWRAFFGS